MTLRSSGSQRGQLPYPGPRSRLPTSRSGGLRPPRSVRLDLVPSRATAWEAGFLPYLSLVAVEGEDVLGHVIATRGWLEALGHPVLGLGPLGVRPEHQRAGIGTVLVHALLAVAEAADERLVALLGSPDYYRRFGFVPAAELGIAAPDPA